MNLHWEKRRKKSCCTRFDYFKSGRCWTWSDSRIQIRTEPDLGATCFSDHRTTCLMKLMTSTMLPAAIKRQYSSVLPLLRHCLPVFDEICGIAMNFAFFVRVTLIRIVNTPLDRSAALVINCIFCNCSVIPQIWLEIWLEPDLAVFPKNGWFRICRSWSPNPVQSYLEQVSLVTNRRGHFNTWNVKTDDVDRNRLTQVYPTGLPRNCPLKWCA